MSHRKPLVLELTQSSLITVVSTVIIVMMMMIREKIAPKADTREIHVVCKVIYQMQSLYAHEHSGQKTVL